MKNAIVKSTIREIKGSFGRWLAILAIVALGVGFFSGLKACKLAFWETGDTYLRDHKFFDFRLISTLGLEDEDVEAVSNISGVKVAEGSYSADALISEADGKSGEAVAKLLMLSDKINTPSLKEGKMPAADNECLADAHYYSKEDIGKQITISPGNDKATADMLAYDTYTITGIADSPLYLNFERGSASIGDGNIACFVMIPAGGWSAEVYTEIYVTLDKSAFIFSEEYDSIINDMEYSLDDILEKCADRRHAKIVKEAQEKVDEAKLQIEAAKDELANGKSELDYSQGRLDEGRSQFESILSYYNQGKDETYAQLQKAHDDKLIGDTEYEYLKGILDNAFNAASTEIGKAESDFSSGQSQIDSGRHQLSEAQKELEASIRDLAEAQKQVDEIPEADLYLLDRSTNIGYICFESDTNIVEGIAKVFPLFFFLVAALVCMTTMSRMIDEQRTQIGVLKAMGYSRNQILIKYIFYSGSSALIGGIGGFFGGTCLFTWVIWEAYGMMYGFADIIFQFDWLTGGLALLAAIICSVGTTLYSCYHELSQVPAQLIRPKAPTSGKRILLERITFIWSRLKFLHKVSLRNIFRYKRRFFMMVLGICGCTALLVTGFGVRDSIKNVVSMQYDEIYHIDYAVTFDESLTPEIENKFIEENKDSVDSVLFLHTGTVDVNHNNVVKSINLVSCSNENPISKFIDLHNDDGALAYPKKGEGIINSNLAHALDLAVGDSITTRDSNRKEMTVTIVGICDNYVGNYLYINDETYSEYYGHADKNSAYIIAPKNEDGTAFNSHKIGTEIMDSDHVSAVAITQDTKDLISNMMKSLDYVIALIILCAGALAFIVLYNLTNINITERVREIATIKVLGFYPKETSAYVFRENIVLTAISALVGLPLGTLLHAFVMERVKIDMLSFDIHIEPMSYLLGVLGTFIFAMIVNFVMYFKINKISMTESLKSIE